MALWDLFQKMESPAQAQPEQTVDETLLELFRQAFLFLDSEEFETIETHTKSVELRKLSRAQWERIRYVCALGKGAIGEFGHYRRKSNLSHDGSCLIIDSTKVNLNFVVDKCGQNLCFLRIVDGMTAPLDLAPMKGLRYLRIGGDIFSSKVMQLHGLDQLNKLEELHLGGKINFSVLDVRHMKGLRRLEIGSTGWLKEIQGLTDLPSLQILKLYDASAMEEIDLSGAENLTELLLREMGEHTKVRGLDRLRNLRDLTLRDSRIGPSIDLSGMGYLENVQLSDNQDLCDVLGLEMLDHLTRFDLSRTAIRRVPDALRGKRLKRLDLSGLELEELPDWLPELGMEFRRESSGILRRIYETGIILDGTTVQDVDMSIFDQPQEVILQWFESRKQGNDVPLREVKVVFLGDGEAGKTHTIARLLNDGNAPRAEDFDNQATPGIVIRNKEYDLDGQKIQVHYWDFGGQEILHSMHRMFLTERTLYVVLINARDDTQDDRARYWLHNIKSFAKDAPVLLVLNKIDQNPNASINETELRELYSGLRQVVRLSALEYGQEQFNETLTGALMTQIRDLGTIGTRWPASWARLKNGLETMKDNFITGTVYKQMCRDSGVEKSREELLHWFNDLGVSFFYQGSRRLENYVILRPEWITNGIYTLLFNKSEDTKNGVIPKRVIYDMLDPEEGDPYRRVLGGVTYDVNETEYVLEVMRKFRLSYPVSHDEEFIPALCQRDSMPIAKTYAGDADALEFRLTYDYLPDNVIHRLMVEMRQDLQLSDVWRTGALFRQQGTGLSAVVKSEGDVLRIFVRGENSLHRPNTYLCILKENIDRINRDMKLAEPYAEVVYKTDRGSECFDYQDLLDALADGEQTYRSKKLRCRVPIQDILNQTGRGVELELQQLQEDIIAACMQLQGNPMYWGSTEDQRNTFLRDALRSRKYQVYDQSFQGVGAGRRGYGELDLEIRQKADIPWTILEALRIRDGSKTEWNRHLQKLLDNYNPSGLNHLFLLTYVDSTKDDFEEILRKYAEHVKWYDTDDYIRLPNTFTHVPLARHGNPAYLRAMRCTYDRKGAPTTVTHIFVRIGE